METGVIYLISDRFKIGQQYSQVTLYLMGPREYINFGIDLNLGHQYLQETLFLTEPRIIYQIRDRFKLGQQHSQNTIFIMGQRVIYQIRYRLIWGNSIPRKHYFYWNRVTYMLLERRLNDGDYYFQLTQFLMEILVIF